jgi:hypothetical protein
MTAIATVGRSSQIRPSSNHKPHSIPHIHEEKDQEQQHLRSDKALAQTPEQQLPNSAMTPEESTIEVGKSWSLIPLRRRCHRLADHARKSKPPRVISSTANPSSTDDSRWRQQPRSN